VHGYVKRLVLTILIAGTLTGARAQLLTPEALGGAFWGTLIGGLAGANCHQSFSGNGAALGAGIGLAAGALIGEVNRQSAYNARPEYVAYGPAPVIPGYPAPVYVQPGYGYMYQPAYVYPPAPQRPNYAVGGTLVGALAGGLIGASQNNGWEGAGIGAASGLVLGGIAEAVARNHEKKLSNPTSAVAVAHPPQAVYAPPPAQPMTTHKPPASPLTVRQVPDAPRVPDAPTF